VLCYCGCWIRYPVWSTETARDRLLVDSLIHCRYYCSCIPNNFNFHHKILDHSKHFRVGSCCYNYDYCFVIADNGDGAGAGGGGGTGGAGGNLHYMLISDQHIFSAKKIILFHGKISKINLTSIKNKQLRTKKRLPPLTSSNSKHKSSYKTANYSKTCLKRNAIVPVFFFPFSQVSVLQRVVF